MSAAHSQETCSTALKKCSFMKLEEFVEHLEPVIGRAGGRRFIEYPLGKQNPPLQGTVSLNDVVKRLDTLWKDLSKVVLDPKSAEAVLNSVTKIQDKDKEADVKLKEKNILIRILTAIRSFFGNRGFNREDILTFIEKAARGVIVLNSGSQNSPDGKTDALPLVSEGKTENKSKIKHSNIEQDSPEKPSSAEKTQPKDNDEKKKTSEDVPQQAAEAPVVEVKKDPAVALPNIEQEEKIEALILALSQLKSDNYAKTKQILEKSSNDIVCAAMRRSINNREYTVFRATMSNDKFESVFRSVGQEARDNKDYQLFALMFSGILPS